MNNNYEKAKEEGIKEIMQEFPSLMVVVDAGGDKDEVDLSDVLFDRLSSFAEKINEGRTDDLREYLQHEPRCNMSLKNNTFCDCGLDKLLSSDSQTIKE